LTLVIPFSIYKFSVIKIYSDVSSLGHLHWNNLTGEKNVTDNIYFFIWILFFLFPLFYEYYYYGFLFGFLTLIIILYNYFKDNTFGSMWCWVVNTVMLYYAAYLLFYLPFYK